MVPSEEEILNDTSTQLVLSSTIPGQRAPMGVKVMRRGKDFLSDKPGVTTLAQLAEVRKTIAETKRIYAIMYSERLEVKGAVKAGELVKAGAIGRVIQTIDIAPHQVFQPVKNGSDPQAGGASKRPYLLPGEMKALAEPGTGCHVPAPDKILQKHHERQTTPHGDVHRIFDSECHHASRCSLSIRFQSIRLQSVAPERSAKRSWCI